MYVGLLREERRLKRITRRRRWGGKRRGDVRGGGIKSGGGK